MYKMEILNGIDDQLCLSIMGTEIRTSKENIIDIVDKTLKHEGLYPLEEAYIYVLNLLNKKGEEEELLHIQCDLPSKIYMSTEINEEQQIQFMGKLEFILTKLPKGVIPRIQISQDNCILTARIINRLYNLMKESTYFGFYQYAMYNALSEKNSMFENQSDKEKLQLMVELLLNSVLERATIAENSSIFFPKKDDIDFILNNLHEDSFTIIQNLKKYFIKNEESQIDNSLLLKEFQNNDYKARIALSIYQAKHVDHISLTLRNKMKKLYSVFTAKTTPIVYVAGLFSTKMSPTESFNSALVVKKQLESLLLCSCTSNPLGADIIIHVDEVKPLISLMQL